VNPESSSARFRRCNFVRSPPEPVGEHPLMPQLECSLMPGCDRKAPRCREWHSRSCRARMVHHTAASRPYDGGMSAPMD